MFFGVAPGSMIQLLAGVRDDIRDVLSMPTTILASDALKILERFLCAYQRNAKLEGFSLKVAIVYHEDFKKYSFGPNHPLIGDYMDGDIAFKLVKANEKISAIAKIDFFKPNEARDEDIL